MSKLSQVSLSVLDLVPIRAGGSTAEALRNSLAVARHVEKLGFKRFWLAEHHNMDGGARSATAGFIGDVARGASRIRLGSAGGTLPDPAPAAEAGGCPRP